ncbi:hypothetical protein EW146_g476 [Bondarzewia mesenterica]|uniref:BTB domain-containing protein n=1 Tax=Bondarzewia mesenterica TaxID=1095465 RepID=A0A4S4MD65_9AGAM|nr:hypothetical protein EW146_g476 [Bondarzewia mesenterica]
MTSPSPTTSDIQAHIYSSFLEGKASDVALNITGTWRALYRLHRVVLIQAGFFRSLFTGGFVESANKTNALQEHPDQIDVVFEDRNITRAAFEYCIARLYGGGPQLFVGSIIPTPTQPLTPSFPISLPRANIPAGHQLASPRFLMSLLATAIYLAVPSVASQALTSILTSVGPLTVVPYLDFAMGKGIGPSQAGDFDAAVGLEHVAQHFKSEPAESMTQSLRSFSTEEEVTTDKPMAEISQVEEEFQAKKEDPADASSDSDGGNSGSMEGHAHDLYFYYGSVSDKIGEAATCWLARWGADMLSYEQQAIDGHKGASESSVSSSNQPFGRRSTMPSSWDYIGKDFNAPPVPVVPVIWRKGGLNAQWVRAVLSSDSLFVKDERGRYDLATTIVEMRRSEGTDGEEEAEFTKMFADGIYYANMACGFYSSAHWSQSLLRHIVMARSPSSPPSSPGGPNNRDDLGITILQSDILAKISSLSQGIEKTQPYWRIPSDSSLRIGDSTGIEGASMDELFDLLSGGRRIKFADTSKSAFFGLKNDRAIAAECAESVSTGQIPRFSPYPPFRFAVEFWDVEALREKSRLHSRTIWYAGSLFNVYVQLVRKKGIQLGVYLHRQSNIDPIPPASAPFDSRRSESSAKAHGRSPSSPATIRPSVSTPNVNHPRAVLPALSPVRSTTPTASPMASSTPTYSLPYTASPFAPAQPYRDPRPAVTAYFTISCASATGSSLTRFTSSPDVFKVSQSWGWKSSSLRTEEYLEVGVEEGLAATMPSKKEVSLRVTIMLGIV